MQEWRENEQRVMRHIKTINKDARYNFFRFVMYKKIRTEFVQLKHKNSTDPFKNIKHREQNMWLF